VLIALMALGAWVRHFFNLRNQGRVVWAIPASAALGVVALALMLWFGLPALADSGRSHRFETLVRSTQTELTTAQSEADLSKRRELLNQAVSNIDEARRLRPGDPQAQSEATSVSDALTVLDAVYNLPDVPTVADLSTVGLSPSSAVEVAAGDRLYVLDVSGGKVFAVSRDASVPPEVVFEDGSDVDGVHAVKAHHIAWQPPQDPGDDGTLLILDAGRHLFGLSRNDLRAIGLRGVEQWRGDTGMAVSGESLYILDAAAGLVWRYASSPSGFDSDPAPAVARADIRDATGISAPLCARHRQRAGGHRPGGGVRLCRDAGLSGVARRGASRGAREQQPGDHHDRRRRCRRGVCRAAHRRCA